MELGPDEGAGLQERLEGLAGGAVGAHIRLDDHLDRTLGVLELHGGAGGELRIDLDEAAGEALDGEPGGLVGGGQAVDLPFVAADGHVRGAGQHGPDLAAVQEDLGIVAVHLAEVVADEGQGPVRGGRGLLERRGTQERLGEGAGGGEGQREGPGVVDAGPVADVLVREGQHGAGAQRVAGGETARGQAELRARGHHRFPELHGLGALHEHLEAHLAGVAGAGEQDRGAVQHLDLAGQGGGGIEVPLGGEVGELVEHGLGVLQDLGHGLDGGRTLDVDLADLVGEVHDLHVAALGLLGQVAGDGAALAGVDLDHVLAVLDLVDDAVVDGVAVLIEEEAVHALALGEGGVVLAHAAVEVAREAPLQQLVGVLAEHADGRHVAGVEQAGLGDDRQMLVARAGVPDGHEVVAELDDVGAVRLVPVEQRGLLLCRSHSRLPVGSVTNCFHSSSCM